jgi:formylglycine-generating enzyme required for sulfatase activity
VDVSAGQRVELTVEIEALEHPHIIQGEDGAEMVLVPAGEFWMGATPDGLEAIKRHCKQNPNIDYCQSGHYDRNELPGHRVTLDAFYIDRFEVTNALFEKFVRATRHRTAAETEGGGAVWLRQDRRWQRSWMKEANWRVPGGLGSSAQPTHPVVQVSWNDAALYCKWAGKRLPTEAEWEKAARGGEGYRFPWGNEWDQTRSNNARGDKSASASVGSYPQGASPYGAHDMAGNVWEWVADWYEEGYYGVSPIHNPPGPAAGTRRVARGGAWNNGSTLSETSRRLGRVPSGRSNVQGFRCAKSP